MTAAPVIESLKVEGVVLSLLPNHRLFVEGPLNNTVREKIRRLKPELIFHLVQEKVRTLSLPAPFELALTTLLTRDQPVCLPPKKWDFVVAQARCWAQKNSEQLREIIESHWTLEDIFGCHQTSPGNRYECMGIVLLLNGREIERISQEYLVFKTASGGTQAYRRPLLLSFEQTTLDLLP